MKTRYAVLGASLAAALLAVAALAGRAEAQVQICSNTGFATVAGTTACDGSASPVTTTATVRTSATLTLEQIFGAPAGALTIPFGNVDSACLSAPAAGVSCAAAAASATWYGDIQFGVRIGGIGGSTAKLTGVRPAAGTIPAGQLLDGAALAQPATAYPVSPAVPINLQTAIGNGTSSVTRSFGLQVTSGDAAGAWSGTTVYSLVIE